MFKSAGFLQYDNALNLINQSLNVKYSTEIDEYFQTFCSDFSYLLNFVECFRNSPHKFRIALIGKSEDSIKQIKDQINTCIEIVIDKNKLDWAPYIMHSFNKEVYFNGIFFTDVFLIFFNKYNNFAETEQDIIKSLYRFETKLKGLL